VFHKGDRTLRCHHCSLTQAVPRACPACGNQDIGVLGHGKNQLGLKRSFDVHVQLGLGHALQQLGQALGRNGVNE
jgi:hypothetical protein